jgi:predicted anti-sigma-YlaC factor YlaD
MRCDRFREAASARLDGEPIGLSAAALDHHLATCTDCAVWLDRATRLTRQLRLGMPAAPDLTGPITAGIVLPAARVLRRRLLLRVALTVVGVVQGAIAVPAVAGDSLGMVMSTHAAHEGAAWNLAIAVALLAAALSPRRASGLIPLLATFVVVLTVLSVHDVAAGAVSAGRIATHLAAVAGLLLLIAVDRAERALPPRGSLAGHSKRRHDGARLRGAA